MVVVVVIMVVVVVGLPSFRVVFLQSGVEEIISVGLRAAALFGEHWSRFRLLFQILDIC